MAHWNRSILFVAVALPVAAQQTCERLTSLSLPGVTITLAQSVAAGSFTPPAARAPVTVPAFCRVAGTITPEVHFELWMPAAWNKKLLTAGNGGLAGTINYNAMLDPLRRGYASSSTDTGHVADNDAHWAQGHMERVIDFANRSVHVTTQADKAIIKAFYNAAPEHSYFSGCSQGGLEAFTEAQRYPRDYDGIIAGDPANYWTHLYAGGHLWIAQATLTDPASYIPATKLQAIGEAVYATCDSIDGIKDGFNDRAAAISIWVLCKSVTSNCLDAAAGGRGEKFIRGREPPKEKSFPASCPVAKLARGVEHLIAGTDPGRGSHFTLGFPALKNIVFENPDWDFRTFRFDRVQGIDSDVDFLDAKMGPIINNINPDLRAFQANGGKLIQYHGWADPDISPLNSINYYQSVVQFMDRGGHGLSETKDFYRLFMVPGMFHCNGGPGPNTFDTLGALEQWKEKGAAPDKMIATHATNGAVDRTRPLCPYPQEAQWKGSGSTDQADNFACALPKVP
jgi:feruloyl esterase